MSSNRAARLLRAVNAEVPISGSHQPPKTNVLKRRREFGSNSSSLSSFTPSELDMINLMTEPSSNHPEVLPQTEVECDKVVQWIEQNQSELGNTSKGKENDNRNSRSSNLFPRKYPMQIMLNQTKKPHLEPDGTFKKPFALRPTQNQSSGGVQPATQHQPSKQNNVCRTLFKTLGAQAVTQETEPVECLASSPAHKVRVNLNLKTTSQELPLNLVKNKPPGTPTQEKATSQNGLRKSWPAEMHLQDLSRDSITANSRRQSLGCFASESNELLIRPESGDLIEEPKDLLTDSLQIISSSEKSLVKTAAATNSKSKVELADQASRTSKNRAGANSTKSSLKISKKTPSQTSCVLSEKLNIPQDTPVQSSDQQIQNSTPESPLAGEPDHSSTPFCVSFSGSLIKTTAVTDFMSKGVLADRTPRISIKMAGANSTENSRRQSLGCLASESNELLVRPESGDLIEEPTDSLTDSLQIISSSEKSLVKTAAATNSKSKVELADQASRTSKNRAGANSTKSSLKISKKTPSQTSCVLSEKLNIPQDTPVQSSDQQIQNFTLESPLVGEPDHGSTPFSVSSSVSGLDEHISLETNESSACNKFGNLAQKRTASKHLRMSMDSRMLATPITPSVKDKVQLVESDMLDSTAEKSHYKLRCRSKAVSYHDFSQEEENKADDSDEADGGSGVEEDVEWSLKDIIQENNLTKPTESDSEGVDSDDDVLLSIPKGDKQKKEKGWLQKKKQNSEPNEIIEEVCDTETLDVQLGDDIPSWGEGNLEEAIRPPRKIPPPAEELGNPIDYFLYFFDEDIMAQITTHTNTYSTLMVNEGKRKNALNLSEDELYKFFGVWIYMGVSKLGSMRDYWAQETYVPQIASIMTFNRFQSIRSSIHLFDKTQEDSLDCNDRFRKVSLLLNHIRKKCNELEQESTFSIDETIIPYKGKFSGSLRQFIKTKPHKFGFKFFNLAGASGMIYDFLPYAGQKTAYPNLTKEEANMGVGAKVVLQLCKTIDFPGEAFVYFDNWFTSIPLMTTLKLKYNILTIGTIRSNRLQKCVLTSDKKLTNSGRGSVDSKINEDGVQVIKWCDNKIVHVASTIAGVEPVGKAKRWNKEEKSKIDVPVPRAIELYNSSMGGVDLHDMLVEINRLPTKAKRWYFGLIGYMVDLALVNSWLLYRRHAESLGKKDAALSSKEFRLAVSRDLRGAPLHQCKTVKTRIMNPRGYRPNKSVRFDGQHSPVYDTVQNRCKYCPKKTKVKCPKCLVNLCFTSERNCFHHFHNEDEYESENEDDDEYEDDLLN